MTRAHRTKFLALCLIVGVQRAGAEEPALNTKCPVMTDEDADPKITLTYRGKTVALCCDRCVKKFQNDPEKYLPNLPQFAGMLGGFASEAEAPLSEETWRDAGPAEAMSFWGRVHPAVVHFPVAGLPLALLGFLAGTVTGREAFAKADVVPLVFAAASSVAAFLTGNVAEEAECYSPAMHAIAERHELISTVVMVLALVLAAFRLWRWNGPRGGWRWVYGAGLFVACALVGATGYLGGSLVFGPDHLKW